MGGKIVFFFHDSDHDPRETQTTVRHRKTDEAVQLNFAFENKLQRKYTPLFLKRIPAGWQANMARQLPAYVDTRWVEAFKHTVATHVADFCLEMYRHMGLLEGIEVVRSSERSLRQTACDISEFFVDVPYCNETVRARWIDGALKLHEGGDSYVTLPNTSFTKEHISPTRDSRLRWMQSVLHCTHYIAGAGEQAYLRKEDAPEINFINRDAIDRSDEAYTELPA